MEYSIITLMVLVFMIPPIIYLLFVGIGWIYERWEWKGIRKSTKGK